MSPQALKHHKFKPSHLYLAIQTVCVGLSVSFTNQVLAGESQTAIELDQLEITAPRINDQATQGYQTKKSSTATKTDTNLIDVPQSITVITKEVVQDQSIQSVTDAVRYVPGVTAAQGEGNRDALVFRGNITTGDLFVDGIRDDVQTYRDFYNTERIEVLKGPNGMIFGRGGAGGAINRVSKEASWIPIKEITTSLGMFDHKRIAADVGDAINDTVAFRMNAVYEDSDSYRDGVDLERYGITPTFTIRPSDNTKIVFSAEYFDDKRIADRGVPSQTSGTGTQANLGNRPYRISDYDKFYGNARLSPTETETGALNAYIEHAFKSGVTIKNRTRYADYNKYYQNVFANSPIRLDNTVQIAAYRDETDRENLFNQTDITYTAHWGSVEHKLLAGAEFGNQDTQNNRTAPSGSTTDNGNFINVSANSGFATPTNFNRLVRDQKSDVDIAAFYVQDQIKLNEHWQAIVGLRHDDFDTNYTNKVSNQNIDVSDTFLSPRAGLIFKPVEYISLYGNYSVSYVPRAGDQLTSLTVTNASFKPEKFINQEIGAKWDVHPDLSLTAAVYKLERENVQVTDPNNPANQILVDGQETKGLELGIAGNITAQWSVFGGIAVQDGEITKQQGSGNSAVLKGAALGQTPDRTLSLWNKYQINDIWAVALGIVSRSEMFALSPTATTSTVLPGYTRFDAAVFAQINKNARFQLNIENLTNKDYALFAHNNNNITPGAPVNARATVIYNF